MAPPKQNPDDPQFRRQLVLLNTLVNYINNNSSRIAHQDSQNALKAIHCLRFIKVNREFIEHACLRDTTHRLVSDFNDTLMHINSYKKGKECFRDLLNAVEEIEEGIKIATQKNKLVEFICRFRHDGDTACIEARITSVRDYIAILQSKTLPNLHDLMGEIDDDINRINNEGGKSAVYRFLDSHFLDYFGKKIIWNGDDVPLTSQLLEHYMITIFVFDPRPNSLVNPQDQASSSSSAPTSSNTIDPNTTLNLIQNESALVKMVRTHLNNWDFWIKQLLDPVNERPVHGSGRRGTPKQTIYTKKTATTLLPSNGKMHLAQGNSSVGFLFDITRCNLKKERFIWKQYAGTNGRRYSTRDKNKTTRDKTTRYGDTDLAGLRQFNQSNVDSNRILNHNEILACVTKNALRGIFCHNDNAYDRVNAIIKNFLLKCTLDLDLPVLVITPNNPPRVLSAFQQIEDIVATATDRPSNEIDIKHLISNLGEKLVDGEFSRTIALFRDANRTDLAEALEQGCNRYYQTLQELLRDNITFIPTAEYKQFFGRYGHQQAQQFQRLIQKYLRLNPPMSTETSYEALWNLVKAGNIASAKSLVNNLRLYGQYTNTYGEAFTESINLPRFKELNNNEASLLQEYLGDNTLRNTIPLSSFWEVLAAKGVEGSRNCFELLNKYRTECQNLHRELPISRFWTTLFNTELEQANALLTRYIRYDAIKGKYKNILPLEWLDRLSSSKQTEYLKAQESLQKWQVNGYSLLLPLFFAASGATLLVISIFALPVFNIGFAVTALSIITSTLLTISSLLVAVVLLAIKQIQNQPNSLLPDVTTPTTPGSVEEVQSQQNSNVYSAPHSGSYGHRNTHVRDTNEGGNTSPQLAPSTT